MSANRHAPGSPFMRLYYDRPPGTQRYKFMMTEPKTAHGLEDHGLRNLNAVYSNLGTSQLLEHSIERREGHLADNGAFVVRTGQFTGRSPKDKFIVRDEVTDSQVQWCPVNQTMS